MDFVDQPVEDVPPMCSPPDRCPPGVPPPGDGRRPADKARSSITHAGFARLGPHAGRVGGFESKESRMELAQTLSAPPAP